MLLESSLCLSMNMFLYYLPVHAQGSGHTMKRKGIVGSARAVEVIFYMYGIYMLYWSFGLPMQSFAYGQYAIYTYCQHSYMLFRSFEPPNFPFRPVCYLHVLTVYVLLTCCFGASNHLIFHSRPVCYLHVLTVYYLHAVSELLTT